MQNLKFFVLLNTLEKDEVLAFHKYLKQLHGGDDTAMRIFEYAKKHSQKPMDEKKLDMAYAFRKVFGTEISTHAYNRKKMLNALYDLHVWLKEFLLTEKIRQDSLESEVLWLNILQERGLKEAFIKQANKLYGEINTPPKNGAKAYLRDLAASHFQHDHLSLGIQSTNLDALQQCIDISDICTEIMHLKMACKMANIKKIYNLKTLPDTSSPSSSKVTDSKSYALLLLYKEILQLFESGEEKHYDKAEQMLFEQADYLDPDEMHGILSYLFNYIGANIRKEKKPEYGLKLHKLNVFGLKYDLFIQKGVMTTVQFNNIISIACSVKEYNWANRFIKKHSDYLTEDIRDITVLQANAIVLFELGKYKEALDILQLKSVREVKDIKYIIRSRMFVLRCYFELQEDWEITESYCISFESLLSRKRKIATIGAAWEFVRICKMILHGKKSKKELIDLIHSKPNIYHKDWLLKQLESYLPPLT